MISKAKDKPRNTGGRPVKHGIYAIVHREEAVKRHPELVRYSQAFHRELLRDLDPEGRGLPAAQRVIVDGLVAKVMSRGLCEVYLGEHGLLRRDRLAEKVLEAEPLTDLWLAIGNSIRRDLALLGLDRRLPEPRVLTPEEMLEEAAQDARDAQPSRTTAGNSGSEGQDARESRPEAPRDTYGAESKPREGVDEEDRDDDDPTV